MDRTSEENHELRKMLDKEIKKENQRKATNGGLSR